MAHSTSKIYPIAVHDDSIKVVNKMTDFGYERKRHEINQSNERQNPGKDISMAISQYPDRDELI